mgnify:CR=1 FL=1
MKKITKISLILLLVGMAVIAAVPFFKEKEAEKSGASRSDQSSIYTLFPLGWNRNLIRHQVCLQVRDNHWIVI